MVHASRLELVLKVSGTFRVLPPEWTELPLECPQDTAEFFAIFLMPRIVATEMDIDTPASQLGGDGAEAPHLVGTYQHMTDASTVFQIFQMIEMVLERPTT